MKEISLVEYFEMIARRKWMIIIILIITTSSSFLVSKYLITPTYSATATLIVGNTQIDNDNKDNNNYNNLLFYEMLVATYSQVLKSKNVLNDVVDKLSFSTTAENIEDNLTIITKQDTLLIDITINDKSPERAMEISNQISKSFVEKITEIMKLKQNVNIVDLAEMPNKPISPNILLYTSIGFFAGLMISIFLTFILEYFDETIKSTEDIKKHLDLPVVGIIPMYNEVDIEVGGDNL